VIVAWTGEHGGRHRSLSQQMTRAASRLTGGAALRLRELELEEKKAAREAEAQKLAQKAEEKAV